jgi:hypothetical protein
MAMEPRITRQAGRWEVRAPASCPYCHERFEVIYVLPDAPRAGLYECVAGEQTFREMAAYIRALEERLGRVMTQEGKEDAENEEDEER